MTILQRSAILGAFLCGLGLSLASAADLSLEQAKQDSGVQFGDMATPGSPARDSAVLALRGAGKAAIRFSLKANRAKSDVPQPPAAGGERSWYSVSARDIGGAVGGAAGILTTAALVSHPYTAVVLLGFVAGGALMGAVEALRSGKRGSAVVLGAARGAGLGLSAITAAGIIVGRGLTQLAGKAARYFRG